MFQMGIGAVCRQLDFRTKDIVLQVAHLTSCESQRVLICNCLIQKNFKIISRITKCAFTIYILYMYTLYFIIVKCIKNTLYLLNKFQEVHYINVTRIGITENNTQKSGAYTSGAYNERGV